jgi:hypothetical protein
MSAQPAVAEAPSIFEKLQEIEGPLAQLNYAIKRVSGDDMTVRYIDNCMQMLRAWAEELAGIANADYNETDELVETLGSRDMALRLVQSDLAKVRDELEVALGRLNNQDEEVSEAIERARFEFQRHIDELTGLLETNKGELKEKNSMIEVYKTRDINMRAEIKALKILEPEKLKKKNTELKTEARADRAKIAELGKSLRERDAASLDLRQQNTILMQGLESERGEVARLAGHIARNDGISAGYRYETIMAGGQPLHFTINRRYHGTYTLQSADVRPRLINNLDFTFIIWLSIGVGAAVSFNEWLRPSYRRDPLVTEYWPDDIYDALEDMIKDELESTHPHLLQRTEWARSIPTESIEGLTAAARKALLADNHNTLRDIVMFDAGELAMTKGISQKMAEAILAACYLLVDSWDKENGVPVLAHGKQPK